MKKAFLSIIILALAYPAEAVMRSSQSPAPQQEPDTLKPKTKPSAADASTQGDAAARDKQSKKELYARVIDVLRATADGSRKWDDLAVSAKVQAQVADLTWEVDEDYARSYLLRAWETAGSIKEEDSAGSSFRNVSAQTSVRREVMLVARKRDKELAKKWLKQMSEETQAEQNGKSQGAFDDRSPRSTVLLQMALNAAPHDPKEAAELAIESLQDGISFGLQNVLMALHEKDFSLAEKVFRRALLRLSSGGMGDPSELIILYSYLYTPGRVIGLNKNSKRSDFPLTVSRNRVTITAAAELNPALARDFLKLAADLLINAPTPSETGDPQSTARSQIGAIGVLSGKMSQQLPEQAEALRSRVNQIEVDAHYSAAQANASPGFTPPVAGEKPQEYQARRIESLEERARKEASPLARNILYGEAALATSAPDYERGWALARNIQDDDLRANLVNFLAYRAVLHFVKENKLDTAYYVNTKNQDLAQRAACLVIGSQKLLEAKDKVRASEWLQEARGLIRKGSHDENWLRIALGIVSIYARFDNIIALEALADAVKMMNGIGVTPLEDDRAPLAMRFSGFKVSDFTYGTTGFSLNSALANIEENQFESVLSILGQIKDSETRGVALVTFCRAHLRP